MTRRSHMIDDSVQPFRLKPGVRYRVVEENGELVVRTASKRCGAPPKKTRRMPGLFIRER